MMGTEQGPPEDDDRSGRLDAAMAEYLAAADAGTPPPVGEWLARYPDLAADLAAFLDDQRRIGQILDPTRSDGPGVGEPTADFLLGTASTWPEEPGSTEVGSGQPRPEPPQGARVRYFGDYELIKILGRGGMGVVYLARQISLDRAVALKMIRAGRLAGEDDLRRFRNEAEAIARLDHPNLLTIFEVGEHEGRRYFSMPWICGGSLSGRLAAYRDDPRGAALMVAEIASAIHHAHQRGILHRDLKPANILIDDSGRPHVGDFGLAKRFEEEDPEQTPDGAVLGTPAYMAPEQAGGRRGVVTTATDVYGLGSILYALLTGRSPFPGDPLIETLRRVVEDAPERPSKLNRRVDRSLESICLKCLEKDPRRRYPSASELSDDLRRWAAGEPIRARPVGPAARLALWCRRRPVPATLAALLLASTLAGIGGVVWAWRDAIHHREKAERRRLEAEHQKGIAEHQTAVALSFNNFFRENFLGYRDPRGFAFRKGKTHEELLVEVASRLGRPGLLPEVEAELRQAIGNSLRALGRYNEALQHLRRARDLNGEVHGTDSRLALESGLDLASMLIALDRVEEARRIAEDVHRRLSLLLPPDHPSAWEARAVLAELQRAGPELTEAETAFRDLAEVSGRLWGADDHRTLRALGGLAMTLQRRGLLADSEAHHRRIVASWGKTSGTGHPSTIASGNALGGNLILQKKFVEAENLLAGVLVNSHATVGRGAPDSLRVLSNLAAAQFAQGKLDEAGRNLEEALAGQAPMLGDAHPEVLANRNTLAGILVRRTDWRGAEVIFRQILDARLAKGGPGTPEVAVARFQLGETLVELGRSAEAAGLLADALAVQRRALAGADPKHAAAEIGRVLTVQGAGLLADGRHFEAEVALREAVMLRRGALPKGDWRIAYAENLLGAALEGMGRRGDAEPLLVESCRVLASAKGVPPFRVEQCRRRLAAFQAP